MQPSFMNDLSPSLGMQHHTVGVATSNLIIAALIEFQGLKLQQGHADDDRD